MTRLDEFRDRAKTWHSKTCQGFSCIELSRDSVTVSARNGELREMHADTSVGDALWRKALNVPCVLWRMAKQRSARLIRDYKADLRKRNDGTLRCESCGWTAPPAFLEDDMLPAHHIVPLSEGGYDEDSNLIVLCPNDHALAHKIWEERAAFLMQDGRGWHRREREKLWGPLDKRALLARLSLFRMVAAL